MNVDVDVTDVVPFWEGRGLMFVQIEKRLNYALYVCVH